MRANARYYLGRVIKIGKLTEELLVDAIIKPTIIQKNRYNYTFTNIKVFSSRNKIDGIFARLSKYKPHASVKVVRPDEHQIDDENVANLTEAYSPFIYIPEFSGIAYQHVWNHLQREQFPRLFADLVIAKHQGFFLSCEVDPVTDMRTFVTRLARLDTITSLRAAVRPPNPLFGPCWKPLRDYIKKRQLDEVIVREDSQNGIKTSITGIAQQIVEENSSAEKIATLMEPLMGGIGDAAVLMAADGYGRAKVEGQESKKTIVIRTSENQRSFLFKREPDPEELLKITYDEFKRINDERYLEH
ncbi:MAG: hypothetical protein QMD44_02545 [Thermodesulfovibrionales bacterium]|jgi:hypothetical protein|nr:hypothetical protein [Thermodesulfovibrionales bacterium]